MRAIGKLQPLVLALALPLGASLIGDQAAAEPGSGRVTGCLSGGGTIVSLAYGESSARPCRGGQLEVTLALAGAGDGTSSGEGEAGGEASILQPFYVTLLSGDEVTLATNGPLEYFARCTIDDGGKDKIEIFVTSTQDGWWDEEVAFRTPHAADDEVRAFYKIATTGQSHYDNDINEGSAIAADGSYMAIDGDTIGLGLNIFGYDCIAAGTVVVIAGAP